MDKKSVESNTRMQGYSFWKEWNNYCHIVSCASKLFMFSHKKKLLFLSSGCVINMWCKHTQKVPNCHEVLVLLNGHIVTAWQAGVTPAIRFLFLFLSSISGTRSTREYQATWFIARHPRRLKGSYSGRDEKITRKYQDQRDLLIPILPMISSSRPD